MYAVKLYDRPLMNTIVHREEDARLLPFCYSEIGCDCIEIVRPDGLKEPYVMIVDEEGLLKDKPRLNCIASYLYGTQNHGQPIVGKVLIMKTVETEEGEDIAWLDYGEALAIMNALDAIVPAAVNKLWDGVKKKIR
jgi:hypothetical protein